jgi:2,5-dichloro-2,5-cyclohexadiene-1,4-diol dehydrogenase 1
MQPEQPERTTLTGKAILVTGGGGGIGAATALLCARRGAAVMVSDRDGAAADHVAAQISRSGGVARSMTTEISSEDEVQLLIDTAVAELGGLDGAVNNAGVMGGQAKLADVSLQSWQSVIEVNLTGTFLCLKHELRHMAANGGGAIVNLASRSGVIAAPKMGPYVASKHGVIGLTKAAAADYAADGIRVNAVLPGVIKTPMSAAALQDPALAAARANAHPLGRFGEAEEVAEMIAWLLSDASSFSTGASFLIDGGASAV